MEEALGGKLVLIPHVNGSKALGDLLDSKSCSAAIQPGWTTSGGYVTPGASTGLGGTGDWHGVLVLGLVLLDIRIGLVPWTLPLLRTVLYSMYSL